MAKSTKILSLLIAYIILIMMPVTAFVVEGASVGNTIYVSESGSDSANGSSNAPYKTFDKALLMAQDGDTIQISGTVEVNRASNGMDDPLIISKKVTIQGEKNSGLYVQTGGIILGADVTFKDLQINFANVVRNAIIANGNTLTLNNVTKKDSTITSIHVFAGGLTAYKGNIPITGEDGKIIISGQSNLGHIFAGSLSDVPNREAAKEDRNEYKGNATIVIEQGASGSIGNIYAHGASESRGEGTGDLLYPSYRNYTVNGDVNIILNQGRFVKFIDGMTGGPNGFQSWATVTYNFPSEKGVEAIRLDNLSELHIMAGHLAPTSGSEADGFYGINFTEVAVAGGAQLDLSNLSDNVTLASLTGSIDTSNPALLGLKKNQTLTIKHPTDTTKSVTGTTAVGIGGISSGNTSWGPIVEKQVYITATNSSNDSFRLLPAGGNTDQILSRDRNGVWTVATGFDVTVNSGMGSGKYKTGDTVTITADSIVGKRFKEWTVVSGGVTLDDKTNPTTSFKMPSKNVVVTAVYEAIPVTKHNVTVTNGTGSGAYEVGTTVAMTANAPESGKRFKEWTVVGGGVTLTNPTDRTTSFEMPASDVEVTAVYEAIPVVKHNVTVTNGTGSGTYEAGVTVTMTANAPESGKQFKEWTVVSGGVTLANPTDQTTSFEMPASDVEIIAVYEAIPVVKHNVTVTNGTGSGAYESGMTVTVTANTPESGKQFKEWIVVSGGVTLASTTSETTTFEVPGSDVELAAVYEAIPVVKHNVTVTNGTGSGAYESGATVTMTANAPENGKQFKGWTVVSGGVALASTINETTSFTMPASEVEVMAVYEAIPVPSVPTPPTGETVPSVPTPPTGGTIPSIPTPPSGVTVPSVSTHPIEKEEIKEVEEITSNIVFLSKEFSKLAEKVLGLINTLGNLVEQFLSPEALKQVEEIEAKYEKMKNVSFDQSTPWAKTPPVISSRKSWDITLSQAVKNTEDNLQFIKVVDMFGDPIDVSIKVDGNTIIVIPNADYVADIPYTLVIAPGLESEQGVKLQQGTHLTFTFK